MSLIDESLLAPPAAHSEIPPLPVLEAPDTDDDAFLYERIAAHFEQAIVQQALGDRRARVREDQRFLKFFVELLVDAVLGGKQPREKARARFAQSCFPFIKYRLLFHTIS